MRIEVSGTAAHGATPWLGDNAVLKALDTFRSIESLPFSRESSDLFDRPSINLGRILGGDAHNKVPDSCVIDVEIRYLPGQDPESILAEVSELPDARVVKHFYRSPAIVDRNNPFVRVLTESVSRFLDTEAISVGRDGASDAISFIAAGVPAVEFGPDRRGPPRSRGVALDLVAAPLQAVSGRFRPADSQASRKAAPAHCLSASRSGPG